MEKKLTCDEDFARRLQEQFDKGAVGNVKQEKNDGGMARAVAAGHDISSSEDEDDHRVKANLKASSSSKRPMEESGPSASTSHQEINSNRDGKPLCPYGADCYRKNPQHFRDFLHHGNEMRDEPPLKKRKMLSEEFGSFQEVLQDANPYNFLLTKVKGIPDRFNNKLAVHIKDILSVSMGELVESAQFNYMHDIPWLIEQYPEEYRSKPLLIVHGEDKQGKVTLHEDAHNYPNVTLCQAKLDMLYGTHHSKMMFLLYTNGMRVVIHTANLVEQDWHQKSQGAWISPIFPKLKDSEITVDDITADSVTHFKKDLLEYLAMYKSISLTKWKKHILQHDFTSARVFLIAAVPGRHINDAKNKWGHMKVRKILTKQGPEGAKVKNWSVIGQFSSVGSLGADQTKYLCGEWLQSMLSAKGVASHFAAREVSTKTLKLIFPTIDNVRTSLEGYKAGASIPYNIQNARRQQYFHTYLHQWKASSRGRSRASPHIKTYALLSPDSKKLAWFMVTRSFLWGVVFIVLMLKFRYQLPWSGGTHADANMSKAAWGALEKNGSQLMIRSYEIGVLFLPHFFHDNCKEFSTIEEDSTESSPHFPLPWDVPLAPYTKADRPWIWDIPYTEKPDSHGNSWVPGRR